MRDAEGETGNYQDVRHKQTDRDRVWLEGLFDSHHQRLYSFAARWVGTDQAEDIVAEVFATAWRRRAEVPDPGIGWLIQIARHAVMHEHRSRAQRSHLRSALRLVRPTDDSADSQIEVDSILNQLDPTDAEVLRLTTWEQLTPTEIAEALQISPGAARNRLMRARQKAQRLYETSRPTGVDLTSSQTMCPGGAR